VTTRKGEVKMSEIEYESEYKEICSVKDVKIRRKYWDIAKGLQAVDNLKTSPFLDEEAEKTIKRGEESTTIISKIKKYYEENQECATAENIEADLVATRIAITLEQEGAFKFAPILLKIIHRNLFQDILPKDWAGAYRQINTSKEEDVLFGRSVAYATHEMIEEQLKYDFKEEEKAIYRLPINEEQAKSLAKFISAIWQTHPFREGNTRTVAVFLIQYLRAMGIEATNEPFAKYSEYFRDALVRSNYSSLIDDVKPDTSYLEKFFDKLLIDADIDISKLDLHCYELCADKKKATHEETVAERAADATDASAQQPLTGVIKEKPPTIV
jgi:fido (protein-threonine AMPylation protein)